MTERKSSFDVRLDGTFQQMVFQQKRKFPTGGRRGGRLRTKRVAAVQRVHFDGEFGRQPHLAVNSQLVIAGVRGWIRQFLKGREGVGDRYTDLQSANDGLRLSDTD